MNKEKNNIISIEKRDDDIILLDDSNLLPDPTELYEYIEELEQVASLKPEDQKANK